MRLPLACALISLLVAFGCATGEGIEDETLTGGTTGSGAGGTAGKVDNPNGGTGSVGSGASGGTVGSGGSTGSGGVGGGSGGVGGASGGSNGGSAGSGAVGGASATGGTGGTAGCPSGEKQCGGVCIKPSPGIGCALSGCTPCPNPPANANSSCTGELCDFTCVSGYVKQGSSCVSTGGGGTSSGGSGGGGTGGATGCPAPCDATDPLAQALCFTFCAFQGGGGLCAPFINCCVCG